MNGHSGVAYWVERNKTNWTTSSAYCDKLPEWIVAYNKSDANGKQSLNRWTPIYKAETYRNSEVAVVEGIKDKPTHLITDLNLDLDNTLYGKMNLNPLGNADRIVFTVNGKMIDVAFIPGAERTLKLAKACGMYEGDLV